MSQHLVNAYLNDLDRYKKISGSITEGVISEAFKDLLKAWSRQSNLHFINQYEFVSTQKTRIRPDGTILHDLRVPLGYWEAKDSGDDLDAEIAKKLAKGYPQDNIIFEDSQTAVLIQNRHEVIRCGMTDVAALLKLLNLFFSYERQEIAQFNKAVEQFKADLPAVLEALRGKIDAAYTSNPEFQQAAQKFLKHAKDTINPSVTEADVREMLIQHILTEEIFAHVFDQGDFHRENNIAKELYALEAKFFTGAVKRNTLKAMETYYAAIRANAASISSHSEKQIFLKTIYENFYKVYNPKAADRLGVVYTPNEIVKFMIEGADWLCEKHFGKNLIDNDVEILDPATGTGTFICELLEHFRGQPQKLAHKYKNELHANEVAILPYYVANLNIEATYAAISGQFAEFPNLCFVDTLDNVAGLGIKTGQQLDMLAGLADENVERVKRQNNRKISVIVGNPPYNAGQLNELNNNKNREYPHIDKLIKSSYVRQSTAQKTVVYDMYSRFFRWASNRLHDDGVIAFITNRSFIDSKTFDGFRKAVAQEFCEIYLMDLGGDVRANPKLSGTKHNVFGIQTGVAISFLIKRRQKTEIKIHYARRPEFEIAEDKLAYLGGSNVRSIAFEILTPDEDGNWLNQTKNNWKGLISICNKQTKSSIRKSKDSAIFKNYSTGIMSGRDDWVYDFSDQNLVRKMSLFSVAFRELSKESDTNELGVKLSRNLRRRLGTDELSRSQLFSEVEFRPFVRKAIYLSRVFVDELGAMSLNFRGENVLISFLSVSSANPLCAIASKTAADYGLLKNGNGGTQCLPRFRYSEDGTRIDNITDWGLKRFQAHYGTPSPLAGRALASAATSPEPQQGGAKRRMRGRPPQAQASVIANADPSPVSPGSSPGLPPSPARGEGNQITKDDIFHYVYGVLHDPVYRETYAINLKREFPRIPFYPDFLIWAEWGKRLMDLHIGYESVEPWPLIRHDLPEKDADPLPKLKADKDNGTIILDTRTTLSGIPAAAWTYRLGNRSGLEWILDQYKEKKPKDPTIREKFNTYRFKDYKEKVIDLLARVTRVSVETMEIVEKMKQAKRE